MNLLNRLFKPKAVKALSIEEQIRALDGYTVEQLLALINGDGSDQVREAAIAKLPYIHDLLHLALNGSSARLQLAARKRIGQLLDEQSLSISQLSADAPTQLDLVRLAGYSQQANTDVLEAVTDPDLLLQLASEGNTTQLRQAAAARIETRTELEQLCKLAQGKDKTVYKLAKARLDVFKAGDAKIAEARAAIAALCDKLEKLSRLEADPMFKAKIALLENEWTLLSANTSPELEARYQKAMADCQQQIAARAQQIAQAEEKIVLDQQAIAFVNTAITEARELLEQIYRLPEISAGDLGSFRQKLKDLTQAVRLAANRDLPSSEQLQEFERLYHHAEFLLADFSTSGTLVQLTRAIENADSETGAKLKKNIRRYIDAARELYRDQLPESVPSASEAVQIWSAKLADISRQEKEKLRELSELTRKGLWAAQQGMVRKARGVHKELQEKRAQLAELPSSIQSKIDELDQAIARLSDWHDFAVTPKKAALIVQMQELANSSLSPNDLASKIHELQDEWKSLSRGVQQADENLWEQFLQASQTAFAPCKEYFDAQTRARAVNMDKRRELVSQLETYLGAYDWDNALWSDVEKTLKVARQEWQSCWPVPRKAAEELQTSFDALMNQIHQKLKDYYQRNKAARQLLIEQAQACTTADNLPQAIDQIKQLQAQWKTLGKSYPKEDQQLWREFRKHCDAVFERRTQELAERDQLRQSQLERAEALISQVHEIRELPLAELTAARETLAGLQNEFNQLDLPRDKAKALTAAFNKGLEDITVKITTERNNAEIRSWQDLFSVSDQLRSRELAILAKTDSEAQKTALEQLLENPPRLPGSGLSILQNRLARAGELTAEQQTRNTYELRLLCIRAEIATAGETPEADKDLRMNYLMKQLQQGIGRRDDSLEPLIFAWVALGAVADEDYHPLWVRFMQCISRGI